MVTTPPSYYEDDEITLKELIEKLQEFFFEVLHNWKIVALLVCLLTTVFVARAWFTETTYSADMTFMVNEDKGSNMGNVASILGQFGFNAGGASEFNLDKILELARSRKIIQAALLEKGVVEGQLDYWANHLIRLYDLQENWKDAEDTGLHDFVFTQDSVEAFNMTENTVLLSIYAQVAGNSQQGIEGILTSEYKQETGIISMSVNSTNQDFSIGLLEQLYKQLSKYYVIRTIEPQQKTYDALKIKTDSVFNELKSAEYQLANFKDSNRGLITRTAQLTELRLEREVRMLNVMYVEAVKNLEVTEFSLRNKTPFFQTIDTPIRPIKPTSPSKLKAILIGGFLGGFLAVAYIIGRKIIRDAME